MQILIASNKQKQLSGRLKMVFNQLQENMVSLRRTIYSYKEAAADEQATIFFLFYGFYLIGRGTKPLLHEQSKDKVIDVITHI